MVGRSEVDGRRQQVDAVRRAEDGSSALTSQQRVGCGSVEVFWIKPQRERRTGLGIKIDDQDSCTRGHQGRGQIDDRGRLGHPTLLVGDGQHSRLR